MENSISFSFVAMSFTLRSFIFEIPFSGPDAKNASATLKIVIFTYIIYYTIFCRKVNCYFSFFGAIFIGIKPR